MALDRMGNLRRKLCIHFIPVSKLRSSVQVTRKRDFSFGEALESVNPLLDMIFEYLNNEDLRNASKVNSTWKEIADRLLSKRNSVSWLYIYWNSLCQLCCKHIKSTNLLQCEAHKNFDFENTELGIILQANNYSHKVEFCVHEENSESSAKKTVMSGVDFFRKMMVPCIADICVILCSSVGSYFSGANHLDRSIFNVLLIPPIPNVRIVKQFITRNVMYHTNWSTQLHAGENVRCVLLFCQESSNNYLNRALSWLSLGNSDKLELALGGGLIHSTQLFTQETDVTGRNLMIAFVENSQSPSQFNASSIVIPVTEDTRDKFEAALLVLKEGIVKRKHTMAFRFCCASKGDCDWEPDVFANVFPNTPLMGMYVNGEIGSNYSPLHEQSTPSADEMSNISAPEEQSDDQHSKRRRAGRKAPRLKRPKLVYQLFHEWTTVFVLLSWGPLVN